MSNEDENGKDDAPEATIIGNDEGSEEEAPDLGISVGVENGNVIIVFSQRLTTIGMPPKAAEDMANALLKHAAEARAMQSD
jgi:hypothetical protein